MKDNLCLLASILFALIVHSYVFWIIYDNHITTTVLILPFMAYFITFCITYYISLVCLDYYNYYNHAGIKMTKNNKEYLLTGYDFDKIATPKNKKEGEEYFRKRFG
jgi:hypothetical protein